MDTADSTVDSSKLPVLYLDWDGVINFFGSRNQHRKRSGLSYQRRGSASPLPETLPYGFGGSEYVLHNSYNLNWSAELLRKIAALPVEVAFLSSWRHSFSELLKATLWELENYRVLDWVDGPTAETQHSGKVPALVADQLANPRPFIWADDEAISFYTDEDRKLLSGTPQLLLTPHEDVGLTMADYEAMVEFLDGLGFGAESRA